jgi:hypothetical protein
VVRAVLWKEWREQAAIIVALLALGGGVMAAAVQFGGPITDAHPLEFRGYGEAGRLAFLMLALTAGTVIGGALFAGEAEAGTRGYLEALPASRWRLWRGKMVAGLALTALAGGVLIGEAAALGALGPSRTIPGWAFWSAGLILAAFGWGAFGSVLSRSTLTACGLGVMTAPVAGGFFLAASSLAADLVDQVVNIGSRGDRAGLALLATTFFLFFGPVVTSGLIFSTPDRARRDYELTPGAVGSTRVAAREVGRRRSGFGARALLWLLVRQYFWPAVALAVLAAVFGSAMLIEGAPMIVGWPAATLVVGVLVGVIGWADEQGRGAARFWGERRLPVGRLWAAKVAGGLALTIGLAVLYLLPSVIRDAVTDEDRGPFLVSAFRSGLLAGDFGLWSGGPGGIDATNFLYFVFLWPVYGFAFGHLAGMLFKKAIVATGVGVLTAGTFAALWLPSFFGGGLHHWQLWPVPLAVVLTARLIARAWAADRVGTRRPVVVLASGVALALGLTAAGLGYRVAEVPATARADDDLKFAATVPTFEQNEAGRDIRSGLSKYQQTGYLLMGQGGAPLFPNDLDGMAWGRPGPNQRPFQQYRSQLHLVTKYGWPADRPDLDAWMDGAFADRWDEPFFVAAGKPLGMIADVGSLNFMTEFAAVDAVREAPTLMIARGLQRQAAGDPAAYVRYLDAALTVARNARNKSPSIYQMFARSIESQALASVDRWLERLAGRPDLLRPALDALARHEATMPTDPGEAWLAGRMVVRNSVTAPSGWAEKYLKSALVQMTRLSVESEAVKARAELEANLLGFAWTVPWEKERLRRVVGLGNDPKQALTVEELTRGAPGVFNLWTPDAGWAEPFAAADRRAAVLRVALRLYEAETRSLPDALAQLVPKYLPAVPADPFDNKPFRYRRSVGEQVTLEVIQPPPQLPFEQPLAGPGWHDGTELTPDALDAMAAGMGGVILWPRPPLPAPGSGVLAEDQFDAVGAVAGGAVQWPLPPLTAEAVEAGGAFPDAGPGGPLPLAGVPPGEVAGDGLSPRRVNPFIVPAETRRVVDVVPGQGIVWSVGADETDDDGKDLAYNRARKSNTTGDLIYVVPLPADKQTAPQPKKEKSP